MVQLLHGAQFGLFLRLMPSISRVRKCLELIVISPFFLKTAVALNYLAAFPETTLVPNS